MPLLDVNYRGSKLWDGSLKTGLETIYKQKIGVEPNRSHSDPVGASLAGLSYFVSDIDVLLPGKEKALIFRVEELIHKKPWIVDRIKSRLPSEFFSETSKNQKYETEPVFTRGSILLAYLLAEKAPFRLKAVWPTLPDALAPVFTDCGISFEYWDR